MVKKLLCTLLTLIMLLTAIPLGALSASAAEEISVTLDDIISASAEIVRQNEGYYHSVNPDDNGALSIGWLQWHANRALNLLRTVVNADTAKAKELLGDTLHSEILTAQSWSTRTLTEDERSKISSLLSTEAGMKAQDDLAAQDLSSYINRAVGYGITDPTALVYYADIENQCGSGGAKKVAQAAAALAGSYADITIEHIHEAALADSNAGRYASRRQKTYNNCLLLDWEIIGTKFEVWDVLSTRNVRKGADTTSELVTSIPAGMKVIISEKSYFDGQTRGRTSMGWITLDPSACSVNTDLTGGYVPAPVIFNTSGGTFGSSYKASLVAGGLNTSRLMDTVTVYNGDYGYSVPQTNEFGAEAAVSADGTVISSPSYGTCKTPIPEGGFVLSGIGAGYTWLSQNVKVGNYVCFDKDGMYIYVYESYDAYVRVSKASTVASGINCPRPGNSLIIYDESYGYDFTYTNEYGTEIAVDSSGKVLNSPKYGLCKTTIPEGGFVLSGIGSGFEWLSQSVKAGEYISLDKSTYTVTVYHTKDKYLSATKTSLLSSPLGELPSPTRAGHRFNGWLIEGSAEPVAAETVCSSPLCITLTASWERSGHKLIFDANGGTLAGTATYTANGINTTRPSNSLIIYNDEYAYEYTQTNEFGGEAAVSADGTVISAPTYGTCKTPIPEGGFVISAIGNAYTWLSQNVKVGGYVVFDPSTSVLTSYSSRETYESLNRQLLPDTPLGALPSVTREHHKFLGWYTSTGKPATPESLMPAGGMILYAKWEVLPGALTFNTDGGTVPGLISSHPLHGTNVLRSANALVIYRDRASTGTNPYGCEVLVSKSGTILASYPYGTGNASIPAGCFILSGNGAAQSWLLSNSEQGYYVTVENGTVYIWADKNAMESASNTSVTYGSPFGPLPAPEKEGFSFLGWTDAGGNPITPETTVSSYGDITLTAQWKKLYSVTLDGAGGSIDYVTATANASGINVIRGANALVIYAGKSSTGTNIYGSEAIVDKNGTVVALYSYGSGNSPIPEGCFALSGNGTMSEWLKNNVKLGSYVETNGYKVTVYSSPEAAGAKGNTMFVGEGKVLPSLPGATLSDRAFGGWVTEDGSVITGSLTVNSDIALTAKWTATKASLSYNTDGGSFGTLKGSFKINGLNGPRPANSVILYNSDYPYSTTYTNEYGTEVAVDSSGKVISSPVYGACKTQIPDGGFVLSGIGSGYSSLTSLIKAGDFILFDAETMTVYVYDSYSAYLYSLGKTIYVGKPYGTLPTPEKEGMVFAGWKDSNGNTVTESTVVKTCEAPSLTATWARKFTLTLNSDGGTLSTSSATVSGTNILRGANAMVLYRDRPSTGTNIYGAEAIIDRDGKVIALYGYGKGNNAIPEGCYALSGNGTMMTWVESYLKVGAYVKLDGQTVYAYRSKTALDAESSSLVFAEGTVLGELPTPRKEGRAFGGWMNENGSISSGSITVSSDMTLTAKWVATSATLTFDADGGSFGTLKGSFKINGLNGSRPANSVILYNSDYPYSITYTNEYGTEVAVDSSGKVISSPVYGACKTQIPDGGFVLSGIGSGYSSLTSLIKAGDFIRFDAETMTVYVYDSYGAYLANGSKTINLNRPYGTLPTPEKEGMLFVGWRDSNGNIVTESTVVISCESPVLYAVWKTPVTVTFDTAGGSFVLAETTVSGTNVIRGANALVLYRDRPSTGTNIYGAEAIIDSDGKVIALYGYGKGNNTIPEGCYALSGNGTMMTWVLNNLKVGTYVRISGNRAASLANRSSLEASGGPVTYPEGTSLCQLPVPKRYGYTFEGWYDTSGNLLTAGSPFYSSATYTARWSAKTVTVNLDCAGGSIAADAERTADGRNSYRGTDKLIIFDGSDYSTSTGTNEYGVEAKVDKNGKVLEIIPYGYGNAAIPEGGFVLSGHDASAEWILASISVGDTVVLDGLKVSVYKSGINSVGQVLKAYGSPFGELPTPVRTGYTFLGWYTSDGIRVGKNSILTHSETTLTLYARWEQA